MPRQIRHPLPLPVLNVRGRGQETNPASRFDRTRTEPELLDTFDTSPDPEDPDAVFQPAPVSTRVYRDHARTALNPVDSPDIGFHWTINPYRGCAHGCSYCYARPTHEYLGLSAGLDFETRIYAKLDAPDLLRRELLRPAWKGEPIVVSGVTDPYQPAERRLGITRRILAVCAELRQPVGLITKNQLILRDLDLLADLARPSPETGGRPLVHAAISITSLDPHLAGTMEPRASSPRARLRAVERLAGAGVPVMVMTAPIIPGLNDREIPALLRAAAEHGAGGAAYVLLRLPHGLKDLFPAWLERHFPDRAGKVLSLLGQCHGGALYNPEFHARGRGHGPIAEQIAQLFALHARRNGLNRGRGGLPTVGPRRAPDAQLGLF